MAVSQTRDTCETMMPWRRAVCLRAFSGTHHVPLLDAWWSGWWLHAEMVYPPQTITHLNANLARRRADTLIKTTKSDRH